MHRSLWQVLSLLAFTLTPGLRAMPQSQSVPTLTRADQVRRLTPEQAKRGFPVRIQGVVTNHVPSPDFFVQDGSAGIYVEGSRSPSFPHAFADLVEVEGVTGEGKFAPVILERRSRVLGKGKLPQARLYSFKELADGRQDSQWVQVRGIVRAVSIDRTSWREITLAMTVASGGSQFKVRVPIAREQDFSSWIDTEVSIEGVCGSLFNAERQLVGVLFYVPRLRFIKVEAPAKEVPFTALLRYSPDQGAGHRVRVRGTVVHQEPGNALFLQDRGRGLRVLAQQDTVLQIGDVVDVLGFPAMGESAPVLEDAVFHRVGPGPPPEPIKFDPSVPWERHDGALVTLDAKLLQREQRPDGLNLVLQHSGSGSVFSATLAGRDASERLSSLPLNSEVRIAGVCLVRSGGLWRIPESFRLLLRSPEDVTVLRTPSWWNFRRVVWLLGITAGVLLIALAWVVVLGRRVREQMAVIRQKLRSGAVLEERNRIARELHDTLEQELAGITMQLDLAVDCFEQAPPVAQRALETARNMSRHSMVGARRSVWDLRCHLLEHGNLVSALTQAVEPLASPRGVKVDVQVIGSPRRLPSPVEMNLLRIGQEAVTNALKHANARHISLEVQFGPDSVRLRVSDDGSGFRPDDAVLRGNGHFGLMDMRERSQSLGCQLQISSQPSGGTLVEVEVVTGPKEHSHAELKANTHPGG